MGSEARVDKATGQRMYSKAPVPIKSGGPSECIDETIAKYIGRADVAAALNVVPFNHWQVCGSNSSFNYIRTELDERVDVYPTIWGAKVRVLIYNGEADACVVSATEFLRAACFPQCNLTASPRAHALLPLRTLTRTLPAALD